MPEPTRVLVTTPLMPYPIAGACAADRTAGILQLKRLGYDVRVLTMIEDWQKKDVGAFRARVGVPVETVEYRYGWKRLSAEGKFHRLARTAANPLFADGSAYEYGGPHAQNAFKRLLAAFQPDLAWFDYTFLWPLYRPAKDAGVPCVTRSINYEPAHFLQECGAGPVNYVRALPKAWSERKTAESGSCLFAITPDEAERYRSFGGTVLTLPLRGLPECLERPSEPAERSPLRAFFMAGSYNITHNRRAMEFVVREVAPRVEALAPGEFAFHVTGKKAPPHVVAGAGPNVVFDGFVGDLDAFLSGMDAAVAPSFYGAGMQQKVFEPLCRKIPLVASERALAGYPFRHGEHLLIAKTAGEFAERIVELRELETRKRLAERAYGLASKLFSREASDGVVRRGIELALSPA